MATEREEDGIAICWRFPGLGGILTSGVNTQRETRDAQSESDASPEPAQILDPGEDGERFREFVEQHYNMVTFANDLKWAHFGWLNDKIRQQALEAIPWLRERRIDIRGQIAEWDVVNEAAAFREVTDGVGEPAMADWFRWTRQSDPAPRLYINDFSILSRFGLVAIQQRRFEEIVKDLIARGAPVDGLGFQAHFNSLLTPPRKLLDVLDRFAVHGKWIEATEFDIHIDDLSAQADYTRGFYIALFSHPSVRGIVSWGFWAARTEWEPQAMVRHDWTIKPNGKVFMDLMRKEWRTDVKGRTDSRGQFVARGFTGDYRIVIRHGRQVKTVNPVLNKEGLTARVAMG